MVKQSPLFKNVDQGVIYNEADRASYKGITLKTFILLVLVTVVAGLTAYFLPNIIESGNMVPFYGLLVISSIVGCVSALIGTLSARKAKYCCSIYAICEGLFIGNITAIASILVPGAASIAVFSTLIIFAVMLTLFGTGVIRVGSKFRKLCYAFTIGAIALTFFTTLMILFFGNFFSDSQVIGIYIGIEAFLLLYGIITLSLNFDEAQSVVENGANKNSEWQVALGLTISIIYIYVELIRLIVLIASNRD